MNLLNNRWVQAGTVLFLFSIFNAGAIGLVTALLILIPDVREKLGLDRLTNYRSKNNVKTNDSAAPQPVSTRARVSYDESYNNLREMEKQIMVSDLFRIVVLVDDELVVNMVYAEVGGDEYEVFGAFSGLNAGGGLFHQTDDGIVISDDQGEFQSRLTASDVEQTFTWLERERTKFEDYDDNGELIGLSKVGHDFISEFSEDDNGVLEAYSDGASEDFIYDCQEEWNLNYYKD